MFTIAVRGREFHFDREYLVENYLRIACSNPHLFFCIVAGHPAYKSVDTRLPSIKALHSILTRKRNKTSSILFCGIENIPTNVVQQITIQYDPIIPIILHGDERGERPNELSPPLAIYSPLIYSFPEKEAIVELLGYLYRLRRTRRDLIRRGYFFISPY